MADVTVHAHGSEAAFAGPELKTQRRAWYTYAWASHSFETIVVSVFLSQYLPAVAGNAVGTNGRVHLLGIPIAPNALFADIVSFSALVLIVLMPIVGALADRFGRKKEMLLTFGFLGAASCAAMWFIGPTDWPLGVGLLIAAYVTYTCGKVVYNSMLPALSGAQERDRISSLGWASGYIGSGILLAGNFGMSFFISDTGTLARASLGLAGLWWAAFALIPVVTMRNAPRPADADVDAGPAGSVFGAGFRQLARTFGHMRAFPMTLLFLVAYLIYYDGITTVTLLAAQFGNEELHLSQTTLLTAILIVQFAAFAGALLLGRLAYRWGAKRVVAWSLVVWCLVVTGAYFMQARMPLQFYVLAIVLSLVLGGSQALSRSLFSNMIPVGMEAEYFSLFEVSGSGSSIFGTLLFGVTVQLTGNFRAAILSLIVLFIVGLGLLLLVNVPKAVAVAGNTLPASLGGRPAQPATAGSAGSAGSA
ncbi:MAG TPA: MFS transporter [Pseudonocardiaceae bacterium]|nr:MFS transporter [Pseudonocardiaceae bacterium]